MIPHSRIPLQLICIIAFLALLAGCGGSSGGSSAPDPSAEASFSPTEKLGIREPLVITFSEAMNTESLQLTGDFVDMSDGGAWSDDKMVLTVSPDDKGAWRSGVQTISGSAVNLSGNTTTFTADIEIHLVFETFQAASAVQGQSDFTSYFPNKGGTTDAGTLSNAFDASYSTERNMLFVADSGNSRVLGFAGIPMEMNAVSELVIGQPDFTSNTNNLFQDARFLSASNGHLVVSERAAHRVMIFSPVPESGAASFSAIVGQDDATTTTEGCSATSLKWPARAMVDPQGRLIVPEQGNNRVLIWNSVPTSNGVAADLVLGQQTMDDCSANQGGSIGADTMQGPSSVWTDNERLVVLDTSNHRVLIWNSFPTTNAEAADIVLGQTNMNSSGLAAASASSFDAPFSGVWSNGLQLFVVDGMNSRLLIWNTFPTVNNASADVVIGQSNFTMSQRNDTDQDGFRDDPSANVVAWIPGLEVVRDKLILSDGNNNRILIFESK